MQAKAYSLIGKYISPKDDFARMREMYSQGNKLCDDDARSGASHRVFVKKTFANGTTTLVAILVVNDRKDEAKEIADSARAEWDDSSFHADLQKALTGMVPDPWP